MAMRTETNTPANQEGDDMKKRYWCQTCGEITPTDFLGLADIVVHTKTCVSTSIPLVEPLATPEPTTWGESHPVGAVCAYFEIDDCPYQMLVCGQRLACIDGDAAAVAGPRVCHDVDDIVQAINYVVGAT